MLAQIVKSRESSVKLQAVNHLRIGCDLSAALPSHSSGRVLSLAVGSISRTLQLKLKPYFKVKETFLDEDKFRSAVQGESCSKENCQGRNSLPPRSNRNCPLRGIIL